MRVARPTRARVGSSGEAHEAAEPRRCHGGAGHRRVARRPAPVHAPALPAGARPARRDPPRPRGRRDGARHAVGRARWRASGRHLPGRTGAVASPSPRAPGGCRRRARGARRGARRWHASRSAAGCTRCASCPPCRGSAGPRSWPSTTSSSSIASAPSAGPMPRSSRSWLKDEARRAIEASRGAARRRDGRRTDRADAARSADTLGECRTQRTAVVLVAADPGPARGARDRRLPRARPPARVRPRPTVLGAGRVAAARSPDLATLAPRPRHRAAPSHRPTTSSAGRAPGRR